MGRQSTADAQLIEAATTHFLGRGYAAVGVSEICAEAGVRKGRFYHFFDSKRDLALAVIKTHSERWRAGIPDLQAGDGCQATPTFTS